VWDSDGSPFRQALDRLRLNPTSGERWVSSGRYFEFVVGEEVQQRITVFLDDQILSESLPRLVEEAKRRFSQDDLPYALENLIGEWLQECIDGGMQEDDWYFVFTGDGFLPEPSEDIGSGSTRSTRAGR